MIDRRNHIPGESGRDFSPEDCQVQILSRLIKKDNPFVLEIIDGAAIINQSTA
jgi:hypothetical protein